MTTCELALPGTLTTERPVLRTGKPLHMVTPGPVRTSFVSYVGVQGRQKIRRIYIAR